MGIIGTIVIGFIVGLLAKFLHPGKDDMGIIMTTVLGIGGSLLASYAGQALGLYTAGQGAGFIGAVIGAIVLLVVYGMVKGKSGQS
ncbi:MAG: GlsB/YeaQ/YmgE family stress response membrane protein [Sterolibacteriaceae bacterium]|nr:GlsB/YeaQ/YmgE family stress response membrane protein [Candidatus Methylophosphatis haderslevensis]